MTEPNAIADPPASQEEVAGPASRGGASKTAEAIRIDLASAWGEMGAAWGVTPAIARVQAYLMTRQAPLTEREVREALGLSHRAASLALAEADAWGVIERGRAPRRGGGGAEGARRGRAGGRPAHPGRRPEPGSRCSLALVRACRRRAQDARGRP